MARFGFVATSGLFIAGMTLTLVAVTGGCQQVLGIVDLPIGEGGSHAGGKGGAGGMESSTISSASASGMGGMGSGSSSSSSGMGASSSNSSSSSSGIQACRSCLEPQRRTLLQGSQAEIVHDLAVDDAGNIIIVGSTTTNVGGVVFDPPCTGPNCALVSAGGDDIFIAKLDPQGVPIWTLVAGDTGGNQTATSVTVDSARNIFVGGQFQNAIKFGSNPTLQNFSSNTDAFIAKIDENGVPVWSTQIGKNNMANETIAALAVDKATGDFLAIGNFSGQLSLGSDTFNAMGGTDVFLSKFASGGTPLWSKQFGDSFDQQGSDVAVDMSGNSFIIGHCNGTIDLGQGSQSCNQKLSVFTAMFNSSGVPVWSKIFGNNVDVTEGISIALDDTGNAFITGNYSATIDFLTPEIMPLTNSGFGDTYVAKLNGSNGNALWSRKFGAAKNQGSTRIAVSGNNVFVTGSMLGTLQFAGGTLTSPEPSTDDIFLIGYDLSGNEKCGLNIGGMLSEDGMALDIGGNGDVILAARYNGPIPIICTDSATHVGSSDVMIVGVRP